MVRVSIQKAARASSRSKQGTDAGGGQATTTASTTSTKPRKTLSSLLKSSHNNKDKRQTTGSSAVAATETTTTAAESSSSSSAPRGIVTSAPSSSSMTPPSSAFSQLELQDLRDSFRAFDIRGRGRIVCGELRSVLEELQKEAPTPQMYPHMDQVLEQLAERNDDDTMDFEGYLQLMESTTLQHRMLQAQQQEEEEGSGSGGGNGSINASFAYVFELFDMDGKGYITVDDLERLARDLGEHDMTREEFEEMIERAHCAEKGKVRLEEFTKIMTMKLNFRLPEEDDRTEEDGSGSGEGGGGGE